MELIVLNIGRDAGVINDKIFAVMVVMCLVTTFMTSPLISIIYPRKYQRPATDMEGVKPIEHMNGSIKHKDTHAFDRGDFPYNLNVLACIENTSQVPVLANLLQKLKPNTVHNVPCNYRLNLLQLVESSERSSTVLKAQNEFAAVNDTLLQMMSLFGSLIKIPIKCFVTVSAPPEYHEEVVTALSREGCNLLVVPFALMNENQVAKSTMHLGQLSVVTGVYYQPQVN